MSGLSRPLRRRYGGGLLGLLFLCLPLASCRKAPPRELHYQDLIVDGGLTGVAGKVSAQVSFCADESRYGVELGLGEELRAGVELGAASRLAVAGCVARPDSPGSGRTSEDRLELRLEGADGKVVWRRELGLPGGTGSFAEDLDLDLPAGKLRLVVADRRQSQRRLFLRELALRAATATAKRQPRGQPPQIVLISIDTLREDAIGALGGSTPTPHLDRFAAAAEVWGPHYAAATWTKPSHASLLTGLPPSVHGADGFETAIAPGVPLLAERLRQAGLATAGLVSDCLWLNPPFGFSRGFADYRSVPWNLPQERRAALNWLAEHRDQPFFFFLHSFEVHSDFRYLPYESPGTRRRAVDERFGLVGYGCTAGQCASSRLAEINEGRLAPLPQEATVLRYLYDRGVAHLDAELGQLFADLEALGLFEPLLIILTADHGEAFLEHGEVLHGSGWNEVQRVPLLIKWPHGRRAGGRGAFATSALDIVPTVLAAAGLSAEELPGQDLATARRPRPVFSWGPGESVIADGWKAALRPDGSRRLFDLTTDPGERQDLAASAGPRLAELEHLLAARRQADSELAVRFGAAGGTAPERRFSADDLRRLRALGYLGGESTPEPPPEPP